MRLFCAFFLKKGSISDQCYIDLKLTPLSLVEKLSSFFLSPEFADSCDSYFSDQIERYGNLKQKKF